MLIELNCFSLRFCVCSEFKFICENNFSCQSIARDHFWRRIQRKRIHCVHRLFVERCVSFLQWRNGGENETTSHTNLSSFHKSKLWIYQFFNFFSSLSLSWISKRCWSDVAIHSSSSSSQLNLNVLSDEIYFKIGADKHLTFEGNWLRMNGSRNHLKISYF